MAEKKDSRLASILYRLNYELIPSEATIIEKSSQTRLKHKVK